VEVKNLNSFKFVREAMEYEVRRQTALLRRGERPIQETRLWDSAKRVTVGMRSKEERHDYRYFPDPDLAPWHSDANWLNTLKSRLPETPDQKRARYRETFGLSPYDAAVLASDRAMASYFEVVVKEYGEPKTAANWITQNLAGALNARGLSVDNSPVPPERLVELLRLVQEGGISAHQAKAVLLTMVDTGKSAKAIVQEERLTQVVDREVIARWVDDVIQAFPKSVADIKNGKVQAMGFLVGQVMRRSAGKASPAVVNQILRERLGDQEVR